MANENGEDFPSVVELNVGGVLYTTSLSTLLKNECSLLCRIFTGKETVLRDEKGRYFLDRDGVLFRYILDYLRNQKLVLPENFQERGRLRNEADYFDLKDMMSSLEEVSQPAFRMPSINSPTSPGGLIPPTAHTGFLTVGYRGSFAFGRDGLADVKFRKLLRILVSGRVTLCREVFGDTLNESRDPDRVNDANRYTARFFLKHNFLEQAFDSLLDAGFRCVAACGSGTSGGNEPLKPGIDVEENRWNHYNEFVFSRP